MTATAALAHAHESLPAIGPEGRGEQLRIRMVDFDGTVIDEKVFIPWEDTEG